MKKKGYPHPLYSMDLMPPDARPQTPEGQAAIEIPQGLLITTPRLQRRGRSITSDNIYQAVNTSVAFHRLHIDQLAPLGLSATWAASMQNWAEQMITWDAQRYSQQGRFAPLRQGRITSLEAQRAWLRRLRLALDLAGLQRVVPVGPPRKTLPDLGEQIDQALALVLPRAAVLKDFGMPRSELNAIAGLRAEGLALHSKILAEEAERRRLSDSLIVVRGALIGDLSRMNRLVQEHAPPLISRGLRLSSLLGTTRDTPAPPAELAPPG